MRRGTARRLREWGLLAAVAAAVAVVGWRFGVCWAVAATIAGAVLFVVVVQLSIAIWAWPLARRSPHHREALQLSKRYGDRAFREMLALAQAHPDEPLVIMLMISVASRQSAADRTRVLDILEAALDAGTGRIPRAEGQLIFLFIEKLRGRGAEVDERRLALAARLVERAPYLRKEYQAWRRPPRATAAEAPRPDAD